MKVHLKVKGGDDLEKSVVEYFQGAKTMLPGLQRRLAGLEKGAKRKGELPASEAFGDPALRATKKIPRGEFPKDEKIDVGLEFAAKGADNKQDVVLRVTSVTAETVEVEVVHPLATKDLEFEVEILAVTDPMPPPLPSHLVATEDD